MRNTLPLVIIGALVLAGCRESAGEYTVVATQVRAAAPNSPVLLVAIEYMIPSGETASWERLVGSLDLAQSGTPGEWYRCWMSAKVGEPLPQCAQEEAAGGAAASSQGNGTKREPSADTKAMADDWMRGLSYGQIAAKYGISRAAAEQRLRDLYGGSPSAARQKALAGQ